MISEDSQDSGYPEPEIEQDAEFECPACHKKFTEKRTLERHVNFRCKQISASDSESNSGLRVSSLSPVIVTKLTHNEEIDNLLSTIDSDYVKFRLAQLLGVTQTETQPILFGYKFPGSRTSAVTSLCPTIDPYISLYNVLIDGRNNHQVNEITMPKNLVIKHEDGEENVSKWLNPTRINARSNRPVFKVDETETSFIYSLVEASSGLAESTLEDSLHQMSLEEEGQFAPRYFTNF